MRLEALVAAGASDPRVRRSSVQWNGLLVTPLAPPGAPIHSYRITYPPSDRLPELRAHDGYEWLYVLGGRLRLRLGDQDITLIRGEAAEFDTRIPHAMSAAGGRPAQALSIFNADGVRMRTHGAESRGGSSALREPFEFLFDEEG